MKQGLSLRVSQHLALTPQLQQSIRLLQLSTLELSQEVEQMLDDNPFLELTLDEAPREEFGIANEDTRVRVDDHESEVEPARIEAASESRLETGSESASDSATDGTGDTATEITAIENDWDGDGSVDVAHDDTEWGGDAPARKNNLSSDGEVDATELARSQDSLQSHLHRQTLTLRLSDTDRAALMFLIESLTDDGYLEEPIEALAQSLTGEDGDPEQLEDLIQRFTMGLKLLHSLEPTGVGARNLSECLSLQLAVKAGDTDNDRHIRATAEVGMRICKHPLELLARRDVKRLSQLCGDAEADIRAAMLMISRLEPKPGRRFVDVERNVVVPDVLVTKIGRGTTARFRVQLNSEVMPKLRVHDIYANALRQHKGEGSQALQQRLQEARWFIKNIQQRFDTILRVSNAIVERQKSFFVHGELAMRPLVLREIADELGLHESTISRVTTAKYMSTPFGTFELKYFFGSALGTETGGNASSTAVRALIRQFVVAEDIVKPLSDNQISEMLKEQGIECARRTVAKYREALRIAPANLRKAI